MKKILLGIASLFTVLMFTQCTKTNELQNDSNTEKRPAKMVDIVFTNDCPAKTVISDSGSGDPTFTWAEGDVIYVYDGTKYCGELEMAPYCSPGSTTASFLGTIEEPSGNEITFFHFGSDLVAPQTSDMVLDCFSQSGTLDWVQSHFIASFTTSYDGNNRFSGEMKSAVAIGNFTFADGAYSTGNTVGIRGVAQKVTVSPTGKITYSEPEGINSSEFEFSGADSYYVAVPASEDANKICFVNQTTGKAKLFDTIIENEYMYRANVELVDNNCTVYYKYDNGVLNELKDFVEPIYEENKVNHEIIKQEPYWEGTVDHSFLGWSENPDDTQGIYTSPLQPEGKHLLDIAGKTSVTLYAIWKQVQFTGPWVDFEHYQFNEIPKLDYLYGWELNEYISFEGRAQLGYDKLNIPIRNLEVGKWYKMTFSEELTNVGGGNMFHGLGVYATVVRSAIDNSSDFTTCLTYTAVNNGDNRYVWVHSLGKYNTQEYTPTPEAEIIFKAEARTMYWIWDLSKHQNGNKIINKFSVIEPKFEVIPDETSEYIDFRNTGFYGMITGPVAGKGKHDLDGAGHMYGQGYCSFISYAEDNKVVDFTSMCTAGLYEKVNIPIRNLQPNTTYTLSFSFSRTSEIEAEGEEFQSGSDKSFCYGVVDAPNTNVTKENLTPGAGGYSETNTNRTFSDTITFTTGEGQTTMYWVWSMSLYKNNYWNTHKITITDFHAN